MYQLQRRDKDVDYSSNVNWLSNGDSDFYPDFNFTQELLIVAD